MFANKLDMPPSTPLGTLLQLLTICTSLAGVSKLWRGCNHSLFGVRICQIGPEDHVTQYKSYNSVNYQWFCQKSLCLQTSEYKMPCHPRTFMHLLWKNAKFRNFEDFPYCFLLIHLNPDLYPSLEVLASTILVPCLQWRRRLRLSQQNQVKLPLVLQSRRRGLQSQQAHHS